MKFFIEINAQWLLNLCFIFLCVVQCPRNSFGFNELRTNWRGRVGTSNNVKLTEFVGAYIHCL